MRDLAVLILMTLDGVMQAPYSPDEDYSGGFKHGGWARNCWDEVLEQVMQEAMGVPYDLLLGRKTYEMFSESFSNAGKDNPLATKLTKATKYVVTSSLKTAEWANTQFITGDIEREVFRLKKQEGPLLQVHGSWQLTQELLAKNLIDEFRLWTFPVVVGSGKRLFDHCPDAMNLKLLKTEACSSGAVMQIYRKS